MKDEASRPYKEAGEWIRKRRKRRGLPAQTLWEVCGLTEANYYRVERGERPLTIRQIKEVAAFFEADSAELQELFYPSKPSSDPHTLPDIIGLLNEHADTLLVNVLHGSINPRDALTSVMKKNETAAYWLNRARDRNYSGQLKQIITKLLVTQVVAYTEWYEGAVVRERARIPLSKLKAYLEFLPKEAGYSRELGMVAPLMVNHVSHRFAQYPKELLLEIHDPLIRSIVLRDNLIAAVQLPQRNLHAPARVAIQVVLNEGRLSKAAEAKVLEGMARARLGATLNQRWDWQKGAEIAYQEALRIDNGVPFIEAQIARTGIELAVESDQALDLIYSRVSQAQEIFSRRGYSRYSQQLKDILLSSPRREVKEIGEQLQ